MVQATTPFYASTLGKWEVGKMSMRNSFLCLAFMCCFNAGAFGNAQGSKQQGVYVGRRPVSLLGDCDLTVVGSHLFIAVIVDDIELLRRAGLPKDVSPTCVGNRHVVTMSAGKHVGNLRSYFNYSKDLKSAVSWPNNDVYRPVSIRDGDFEAVITRFVQRTLIYQSNCQTSRYGYPGYKADGGGGDRNAGNSNSWLRTIFQAAGLIGAFDQIMASIPGKTIGHKKLLDVRWFAGCGPAKPADQLKVTHGPNGVGLYSRNNGQVSSYFQLTPTSREHEQAHRNVARNVRKLIAVRGNRREYAAIMYSTSTKNGELFYRSQGRGWKDQRVVNDYKDHGIAVENFDGRLEFFYRRLNGKLGHAWQKAKQGEWLSNGRVQRKNLVVDDLACFRNGVKWCSVFYVSKGNMYMWTPNPVDGAWSTIPIELPAAKNLVAIEAVESECGSVTHLCSIDGQGGVRISAWQDNKRVAHRLVGKISGGNGDVKIQMASKSGRTEIFLLSQGELFHVAVGADATIEIKGAFQRWHFGDAANKIASIALGQFGSGGMRLYFCGTLASRSIHWFLRNEDLKWSKGTPVRL